MPHSRIIYILLAFFFGMFGLHHAFVGKKSDFRTMFWGTIIGFATLILIVGFFILLILCLWALCDFYKACTMSDEEFFDLYHK